MLYFPLLLYSGLDSSSSTSLITLMNSLARGGRTLIATIHQPSALIFEKIDTVYCLQEGRTLYNGPRTSLVPALASAGLRCPPYHNPADFCKYNYFFSDLSFTTVSKSGFWNWILWTSIFGFILVKSKWWFLFSKKIFHNIGSC